MKTATMLSVKGTLLLGALLLAGLGAERAWAQEGTTIPDAYRGTSEAEARGVLDGNLIRTNYRNFGELSRWRDNPYGVWPRGSGGRHMDGVAVVVAGLVKGTRPAEYYTNPGDTLLNPVILNYRGDDIGTTISPLGTIWGWLPLPGFHNPFRTNDQELREPVPALSTDPRSWPAFWPDKLQEEDAGWRNDEVDNDPNRAAWNGMFGKGVFNADQETFYVMDDRSDQTYQLNPNTGEPFSEYGLFYPDPADPDLGGLGLQVNVRLLQWANILAEDTMFLIYRITNLGQTDYGACVDLGSVPPNALPDLIGGVPLDDAYCPGPPAKTGLFFTQFVDYGLGEEEGDEVAAFDPQLDIAYGWDVDGIGERETGGTYALGYTGFAFLESPTNDQDGQDNDEDGLVDEQRFSDPAMLQSPERIVGQDAIREALLGTPGFNSADFARHYGRPGQTFEQVLASRPAFQAGVWYPVDDDLDWSGFEDRNGNGRWDAGELLNDDYGRDGLGPYDLGYPGPDEGEADGVPTIGEPNFDELDVDESDQVGLTGFDLAARTEYQPGTATNMVNDSWMWNRIKQNQFALGTEPDAQEAAGREPFLNFSSGPVNLGPNETDFFSTAWIFGWDEQDFFNNRQVVQNIYDADYRFAQPPTMPTLKAEAGDGQVVLSWDTQSLSSFDRFTQCNDFEGFKLYKGTDETLSDARTITDARGTPTFYRPLAQWDLANGIAGNVPVLENQALYDMGADTGLQFSYIDREVTNGKRYYYALVAYDHGTLSAACASDPGEGEGQNVDPQENTFNARNLTPNVQVVVPRAQAAGYVPASASGNLQEARRLPEADPSVAPGTGGIDVTVVNSADLRADVVYELSFFDSTSAQNPDVYVTSAYQLRDVTNDEVLVARRAFSETTPAVDGFVVELFNDELALDLGRSGWVGTDDGRTAYSRNPAAIEGVGTNWGISTLQEDNSTLFREAPYEYELVWTGEDSLYTSPRRAPGDYLTLAELPFWCNNLTTGRACQIFPIDVDDDGEVDLTGDVFVIADQIGFVNRLRYQVAFSVFGAESDPPDVGDRVHVGTFRPFAEGDYFQFTLNQGRVDPEAARSELDRVAVVPNPYVAAASWEARPEGVGRGDRQIQFINLPEDCTIQIFTMRGELVQTIEHDGVAGDGAAWWDLKTRDNQEVAYGVYFYHVQAPGIGETVGKFAIVK